MDNSTHSGGQFSLLRIAGGSLVASLVVAGHSSHQLLCVTSTDPCKEALGALSPQDRGLSTVAQTVVLTGRCRTRRFFASGSTRYEVGVHLLGRRLYETMLYWETAEQEQSLNDAELEWASLWKPLPKVVFSSTLSAVEGNARLAPGGLAEEVERLRAEPGVGDIAIGGATLASGAAALDLIDEYRAMVHPVLVGGGIPFFPQHERRVDLELVETHAFSSQVVYLRYRVPR